MVGHPNTGLTPFRLFGWHGLFCVGCVDLTSMLVCRFGVCWCFGYYFGVWLHFGGCILIRVLVFGCVLAVWAVWLMFWCLALLALWWMAVIVSLRMFCCGCFALLVGLGCGDCVVLLALMVSLGYVVFFGLVCVDLVDLCWFTLVMVYRRQWFADWKFIWRRWTLYNWFIICHSCELVLPQLQVATEGLLRRLRYMSRPFNLAWNTLYSRARRSGCWTRYILVWPI